jgi:pyruvate/2-oxoglutarate/acetoin dehydrogenase E1 component
MAMMTYHDALDEAVAIEMRDDERIFYMATDVPEGLLDEFGSERVRIGPIAENSMTGMAIGAAASGFRPVVHWRSTTFTFVAYDQIVNHVAKLRYMVGGQVDFPILFRCFFAGGRRSAAQHTQSAYAMLAHVPGLKIIAPASAADGFGLIRSAIQENNPVISFESSRLFSSIADVPDDHIVPLGVSKVVNEGSDITVVALGSMVETCLEVAGSMAGDGISVEVIDPRTLVPLDAQSIIDSIIKTGRLVVADESPPRCSMASEIITTVVENGGAFKALKGAPERVTIPAVPIPYSPVLEDYVLPDAADVEAAVRRAMVA